MTDLVTLQVADGVAVVTLNRPERLNAINVPMGEAFDATMVAAALDPRVRVIVVTGAGDRGFCVGADMARLDGLRATGSTRPPNPRPGTPHPVLDALTDAPAHLRSRYTLPMAVPQPVIAAINGACAGVGLALAVNCDVRFASRSAIFAAGFPQRGLTAEAALAKTLSDLIGKGRASDLLLSGRKVSAEEALGLGLVNAVHDFAELAPQALAYARAIAQGASPRSTRIIKRQLRLAGDQTFEAAQTLSYDETLASLASEDFQEGVVSYTERRPPRFVGR
jgi:enoyl-CoA hydratase/carnithine racemase